jgi:hypothetical protein
LSVLRARHASVNQQETTVARVRPPKGRATIVEGADGLEVTIPPRKNWLVIVLIGLWMIGWAVGEAFAIHQLFWGRTSVGVDLFLLAWLGAWTVGGALAGYAWLWMVFGVEKIALRPDVLIITRKVFGFARRREYDLAEVRNLRPAPVMYHSYGASASTQFGGGGGCIAFDYGARTFRFAADIDEAEANTLVHRLKSWHRFT